MGLEASNLLVGANGEVYVANLDNTPTLPDDIADVTDSDGPADFDGLGLCDDSGIQLNLGRTFVDVKSWQRMFPTKRIPTDFTMTVSGVLQEWNTSTLEFVLASTVTATGTGSKITPVDPETIPEFAMIVWFVDDSGADERNYALVLPRCTISNSPAIALQRGQEAKLPFEVSILASDDTDGFFFLTDDDNTLAGS